MTAFTFERCFRCEKYRMFRDGDCATCSRNERMEDAFADTNQFQESRFSYRSRTRCDWEALNYGY